MISNIKYLNLPAIIKESHDTNMDLYDLIVYYDLETEYNLEQLRRKQCKLSHYEACQVFKNELIYIIKQKERYNEMNDNLEQTKRIINQTNKLNVEQAKNTPIEYIIKAIGIDYNPRTKKLHSIYKEENTPSMHVYEKTNSYHCFATHKGGDGISLVMNSFNVDFKEAVKYINNI